MKIRKMRIKKTKVLRMRKKDLVMKMMKMKKMKKVMIHQRDKEVEV